MRISTHIVFVMIILTASSNMMVASGVAEDIGIAPQPGQDDLINTVKNDADIDDPNPGGGGGDTLFGLFTSTANIVNKLYRIAFAADIMFQNIGVPAFVTAFLFKLVPFLAAIDILYVFTGRDV